MFEDLAGRRKSTSASSRRATRSCSNGIRSWSRGRRSSFKGAAHGLFAEGAERLLRGVNDQQALMIGIRCERGSPLLQEAGERFEDSEGKQIFLEFADEEREHLDLLVREYRALLNARAAPDGPSGTARPRRASPGDGAALGGIDLHPPYHRLRRSLHAAGARPARGQGRTFRSSPSRITTRQPRSRKWTRKRGTTASTLSPVLRLPRWSAGRDLHVLGYLFDPQHQGLASLLVSAQHASPGSRIASRLAAHGVPIDVEPMLEQSRRESGRSIGRPQVARDGRGGTRGKHAGGL